MKVDYVNWKRLSAELFYSMHIRYANRLYTCNGQAFGLYLNFNTFFQSQTTKKRNQPTIILPKPEMDRCSADVEVNACTKHIELGPHNCNILFFCYMNTIWDCILYHCNHILDWDNFVRDVSA